MATKAQKTYPVWVGDLKEDVTENDLQLYFSHVGTGTIASCKIMRNEHGISKFVIFSTSLVSN